MPKDKQISGQNVIQFPIRHVRLNPFHWSAEEAELEWRIFPDLLRSKLVFTAVTSIAACLTQEVELEEGVGEYFERGLSLVGYHEFDELLAEAVLETFGVSLGSIIPGAQVKIDRSTLQSMLKKKARRSSTAEQLLYTMRIELVGAKPPIWRKVQIPGYFTLRQLDRIIHTVMGWSGTHMHQFIIDGEVYTGYRFMEAGQHDESRYRLDQLGLAKKSKFDYIYDFCDHWRHLITVTETAVLPDTDSESAICVSGKRACPPEDCGGMTGYYKLIESIESGRKVKEYPFFVPDECKIDEINAILTKLTESFCGTEE